MGFVRCSSRNLGAAAAALLLFAIPQASAAPQPQPPAAPQPQPPAAPQPQPPAAPQPQPSADERAEAKSHFDKGNVLYEERKDPAAALAEFLESRRLYPTWSATFNAALCLEDLRRYDDALSLLESALRDFGGSMPTDAREGVQRRLIAARALVGTIEVEGAEPGATIDIDGQKRGEYPLLVPLRVAAGSHIVQLYKDGFAPFGTRLEVAGGRTVHVQVRLRALERVGRLRVVEQGGMALDVLVDGGMVGATPWEGRLAPGEHIVVLRGAGRLGTAPMPVVVEVDQTTRLTLAAEELTAEIRIEPVPANASVALDAIAVGRGVWSGRLRAGTHKVEVAAPGFLPWSRQVILQRDERRVLNVVLERDPTSPFTPPGMREPRFVVEASGAAMLVPSFGGDVARACSGDCDEQLGAGVLGMLRVGYELGFGLGFGLSGGYLAARQEITGRSTPLKPVGLPDAPALADDLLELSGPLAGAWAGVRLPTPAPVHFRLGAGALFGTLTETRRGSFTPRSGLSEPFGPLVEEHTARFFWLAPGLHVGFPLHPRFELYPSFDVLVIFNRSPPRWDASHAFHAATDGSSAFAPDPLTGVVFVVLAPGLGARFDI
jgi:PEGA domain